MNQQRILDLLEGRVSHKDIEIENASSTAEASQSTSMRPPPVSGMEPYEGPWGVEQARHLLKRTTYGHTQAMLQESVANGMEWTVEKLLEDLAMPSPPLAYEDRPELNTPFGETWVDNPYTGPNVVEQVLHRERSLLLWQMGLTLNSGFSVREKMTLFWHNHYAIESDVVNDPRFQYRYLSTLRANAFGNFRELTKMITIDPAMLRYLNGNQNQAEAPNENYARELLELFSIGKGPQVGDGDYTTYTEQDVLEGARILTGWRDQGFFDFVGQEVEARFFPFRHDNGTKQLSHRFENAVITNAGEDEYANFIDLIYTKTDCARFISRKLYRWFVYYEIAPEDEGNVIESMAQTLVDNDYEIKPLLRMLFSSAHFYDPLNCGCMIKNPFDFAVGYLNELEIDTQSSDTNEQYRIWQALVEYIAATQMLYFDPPSVAGWPAYHQSPSFSRLWTTSATLPLRMGFTDIMTYVGFTIGDTLLIPDFIQYIENFANPLDPNSLIDEAISRLLPKDLLPNQKDFLKGALIFGLPDFEWTLEYQSFLDNPDDDAIRASIEAKLRSMFRTLFVLPEYHLS